MEVLTFILLVLILILFVTLKNDVSSKLSEMNIKLDILLKRRETASPESAERPAQPHWDRQRDVRPAPYDYTSPQATPPEVHTPPVPAIPEVEIPVTDTPVTTPQQEEIPVETASSVPGPVAAAAFSAAPESLHTDESHVSHTPPQVPPAPAPGFFERYPDLEKFIGENLFNKIGIAILVIGIGFFLKYAIDKNWINETGRTFIGILCGAILIGLAHKLRKQFNAFSSVLVGGGVAVLYFSITIAFQQYHLIGQTPAFIMMVLITAFTVVLSLSYDRRELAVLAILGGFSSPLLISTGAGSAAVLFTYILILNIGMLILAYYKKWNIVNIISYAATIILFGSWLSYSISHEASKPVPYITALVFATLFYIVFFLMNVINNLRQRVNFKAAEITILLSNTFFYYTAGMIILAHIHDGLFQGLFTACIAIFNFIFAYSLYRNQHADKNLIYLLIGLTLSFLSLAAPVQLHGNYITLFWAAESVLLLWLYQRSYIKLLKYAATIVFALMCFSLMIDWSQVYLEFRYAQGGHRMWPLVNQGFVTGAVCIVALFIFRKLLSRERDAKYLFDIAVTDIRLMLGMLAVVMIYVVGILELHYQTSIFPSYQMFILLGIYNYLFAGVLHYISRKELVILRFIMTAFSAVAMISFMVFYNEEIIDARMAYLEDHRPVTAYLLSYVLIAALFALIYQTYLTVRSLDNKKAIHIFQWVVTFCMLYILSALLDHIVVLSTWKPGIAGGGTVYTAQRTGYTILWGAFAFALIYLGFRWQSKQVRIIAISLFAITLLKLFLYDLHDLSEGGKIAAFISLGIILLVISFMYQRLKKILLTDDDQREG